MGKRWICKVKKNMHRTGSDNRGISLLEIIIAVTIFSIAAIVLLKGFSVAGTMNKKSDTYLQATTAAQNLIEGVKSHELEELALQFNYPWDIQKNVCRFDVLNVSKEMAGDILNKSIVIREVNKDGKQPAGYSSIISSDGGKTHTFEEHSNGQYFFQIQNLKMGNKTFDAAITVDGLNSVTDEVGGGSDRVYKDNNPASGKPNNYKAPNLGDLNVYEDAFLVSGDYQSESSLDYMAYKHMIEKEKSQQALPEGNLGVDLSMETLAKSAKRSMDLRVQTEGGSVKAIVTYTVHVPGLKDGSLRAPQNKEACPGGADGQHDGSGSCFCTNIAEHIFYDNSETGSDLRRVYFFYCPNYQSVNGSEPLDQITFHNEENMDLELFIAKQRGQSVVETTLRQQEANYKAGLEIIETPRNGWNTLASQYEGATKLRTNLNTNIAYESLSDREKDKSALGQMLLTYRDKKTNRTVNNQSGNKTAVLGITQFKNLEASETKYRIFSLKVSIYQADTLTKPQNEWADRLIVSLNGSKDS